MNNCITYNIIVIISSLTLPLQKFPDVSEWDYKLLIIRYPINCIELRPFIF